MQAWVGVRAGVGSTAPHAVAGARRPVRTACMQHAPTRCAPPRAPPCRTNTQQVTLVVTDVEGSTELWEWDHNVMTLAQEVHDSVMRTLIGRWGRRRLLLHAARGGCRAA